MESYFGYEKLQVWQKAVEFALLAIALLDQLDAPRKHYRLIEQLEAACTSVSMNLAEGKGRYSRKEFVHFCYTARGSLYETMTLLEIFRRKNRLSDESFQELNSEGLEPALCSTASSTPCTPNHSALSFHLSALSFHL